MQVKISLDWALEELLRSRQSTLIAAPNVLALRKKNSICGVSLHPKETCAALIVLFYTSTTTG
jgi:hypothetical protein